jgi:alcohol dehydrogenase
MPRTISEHGVTASDVQALATMATIQWTAQFNPRKVSEEDFAAMFNAAL